MARSFSCTHEADSAFGSRLDFGAAARLLTGLEAEDAVHDDGAADYPAIEGYRVEARIGRGATSTVYRAVREGSQRPLAVKLMHSRLVGRAAQRAWRELDVLSETRLACIPRVIDYGTHEGRLYIATELVEGATLATHVQSLDRRERVELLARVGDAAHMLHERGTIHRDLKPSNILVAAQGDPMIIDLGIASLVASDAMETLTHEGAPLGTPAYMSPEQARGERAAVSTRSDVYALGAIG